MKVGDFIKIKESDLKDAYLSIDFHKKYEIEKIEYMIADIFRVKLKNELFWVMCFDIDGYNYEYW